MQQLQARDCEERSDDLGSREKEIQYLPDVLGENNVKLDRLFIVGKGSSLKGFDFSLLKDEYTIALNGAFEWFDAKAVFFLDRRFLERYRYEMQQFKGDVYAGDKTGWEGNTYHFNGGVGKLSGLAAIQVAVTLAEKIYLLGYDLHRVFPYQSPYARDYVTDNMFGLHKQTYYMKDHWIMRRLMLFDKYFSQYKDRVFNLNPFSNVTTFPFVRLDEVLDI